MLDKAMDEEMRATDGESVTISGQGHPLVNGDTYSSLRGPTNQVLLSARWSVEGSKWSVEDASRNSLLPHLEGKVIRTTTQDRSSGPRYKARERREAAQSGPGRRSSSRRGRRDGELPCADMSSFHAAWPSGSERSQRVESPGGGVSGRPFP